MSQTFNFKNSNLQRLYDVATSNFVAKIPHTQDIHMVLYPYILLVIKDPEAYQEGIASNWQPFTAIIDHVNGNKHFKLMDHETSMCFSMFMYING
jgi:hypothetical protein